MTMTGLSKKWGSASCEGELLHRVNATQFSMTLLGHFPTGEDLIPFVKEGLAAQVRHFSAAASFGSALQRTIVDKIAYFARDKDVLFVLTDKNFEAFFFSCRSAFATIYGAAPGIQQYILRKLVNMAGQPVILSLAASYHAVDAYLSTAIEQISTLTSEGTDIDRLKIAKDLCGLFLDVRDQAVLNDGQEAAFFDKIGVLLNQLKVSVPHEQAEQIQEEVDLLSTGFALGPSSRLSASDYQQNMYRLCASFKACSEEAGRISYMEDIANLTRNGPVLRSFVEAKEAGRKALFAFCRHALMTLVPEDGEPAALSPHAEMALVKQSSRTAFTRNVYEAVGGPMQSPLNDLILDVQERLFAYARQPGSRAQIVQNLFDMSQDNDVIKTVGYEGRLKRIEEMLGRFLQDDRLAENEREDYFPIVEVVRCFGQQYRVAAACSPISACSSLPQNSLTKM